MLILVARWSVPGEEDVAEDEAELAGPILVPLLQVTMHGRHTHVSGLQSLAQPVTLLVSHRSQYFLHSDIL